MPNGENDLGIFLSVKPPGTVVCWKLLSKTRTTWFLKSVAYRKLLLRALPMARTLKTASGMFTTVWAMVDGVGGVVVDGGTLGFQPAICPFSVANRNTAFAAGLTPGRLKSLVPLNTVPVGLPPGMVT